MLSTQTFTQQIIQDLNTLLAQSTLNSWGYALAIEWEYEANQRIPDTEFQNWDELSFEEAFNSDTVPTREFRW